MHSKDTVLKICYFVLISICVLETPVFSHKCESFQQVFGQFVDKNGFHFNKTIDGCIERTKFDGKTIVEAYIRNQDVKTIGKDSVRNVIHLSKISFWGCTTKQILPGAFRNVPELKVVQISYCKLKEIPKGVFDAVTQLEMLRFHDNEVDVIENEAFANLTSLKRVYGSWNKLEYWNREWFGDSRALDLIDFQYNKIRTIPRRAFESMPKLRHIYFDYNEIDTIQADAFEGLRYLEYLGLRNNRLKELAVDVFPNKLKIKRFLISANYLNFISNEVLKKISVQDILMDYNPWKCSCLFRIYYWIHSSNVTLSSDKNCYAGMSAPICAVQKDSSQTCLEYVDEELTQWYLTALRSFPENSQNTGCARLD